VVGDLKNALTVEVPGQNQELDFDEAWPIETSAGKYMKTAVKAIVAITQKVFCCACLYVVSDQSYACVCVTGVVGPESCEPDLGTSVRGRVNSTNDMFAASNEQLVHCLQAKRAHLDSAFQGEPPRLDLQAGTKMHL